jgi:hypothetical protein
MTVFREYDCDTSRLQSAQHHESHAVTALRSVRLRALRAEAAVSREIMICRGAGLTMCELRGSARVIVKRA